MVNWRKLQILFCTFLFLTGMPYTAKGQEFDIYPVIDNEPTCKGPLCRIELERTQTLAGDAIVEAAQLKRDSRGRFFMWSDFESTTVYVLDQEGQELGTIGRSGEGPGEFRWIAAILIGKGDTLRVYDADLSRETLFEPQTFDPVVTKRLAIYPYPAGALRLSDGRLVLNSHASTRERYGFPLHVLNRADSIDRSFGRLSRQVLPGDQPFLRRVLAEYAGNVVSISLFQYLIEIWDPNSGDLIAGFERRPTDFRPRQRGEETSVEKGIPPPSVVMDARIDGKGRLWVLSWVPGRDWKKHVTVVTEGIHRGAVSVNTALTYDTVIDVIDLDRQQLIATRRVDVVLRGWVDAGYVFSYREDDGFNPRLDVWRLTLRNP